MSTAELILFHKLKPKLGKEETIALLEYIAQERERSANAKLEYAVKRMNSARLKAELYQTVFVSVSVLLGAFCLLLMALL
jgi:hypothetical protein